MHKTPFIPLRPSSTILPQRLVFPIFSPTHSLTLARSLTHSLTHTLVSSFNRNLCCSCEYTLLRFRCPTQRPVIVDACFVCIVLYSIQPNAIFHCLHMLTSVSPSSRSRMQIVRTVLRSLDVSSLLKSFRQTLLQT